MRSLVAILIGVFMVLLCSGQAESQKELRARLGKRIRIKIVDGQTYSYEGAGPTVASGEIVSGRLQSASERGVVLRDRGTGMDLWIPAGAIQTVQAYAGQKSHAADGCIWGLLLGGLGGGIWASATYNGPSLMVHSGGESAATGALLGGIAGGVIGFVIGGSVQSDQWEDVFFSGVETSILSSRGIGIGLSIPVGR